MHGTAHPLLPEGLNPQIVSLQDIVIERRY